MKNELAFSEMWDATNVAESLIKNNYVVMLSREENLIILNYVWAQNSDRRNVAFGDYEEFKPIEK